MNGIFVTGQIPKGLKVSVANAVYERGNKQKKLSNYRQMAISSVLSDITEKI